VLQRNTKLYGPLNALDCENSTTSWNSEGNSAGKTSSSFLIDFHEPVIPLELRLQYQAGFAAEDVSVLVQHPDTQNWIPLIQLEVEDDHDLQCFPLVEPGTPEPKPTQCIKFVFDECTDFYARIIIYKLQVWGRAVVSESKE